MAIHMRDYRVESIVEFGRGLDHITYKVNDELIVRFGTEVDVARLAAEVDREARLLTTVAEISPLPVPKPVFADAQQGCLAYFQVPGVPLLDVPERRRLTGGPVLAATLGDFLAALHTSPIDAMRAGVDADAVPLAQWRQEAAEFFVALAEHLPAVHQPSIEVFLSAAPPDDPHALVFSHNDLGIEHVLVDPIQWVVTGIIDWSDAAIVDPAYDFGLIHRDLGPTALDAALTHYRNRDLAALRERAVFYARCSVFEDLAYGLETGQRTYVDKSLGALTWLFPA